MQSEVMQWKKVIWPRKAFVYHRFLSSFGDPHRFPLLCPCVVPLWPVLPSQSCLHVCFPCGLSPVCTAQSLSQCLCFLFILLVFVPCPLSLVLLPLSCLSWLLSAVFILLLPCVVFGVPSLIHRVVSSWLLLYLSLLIVMFLNWLQH